MAALVDQQPQKEQSTLQHGRLVHRVVQGTGWGGEAGRWAQEVG